MGCSSGGGIIYPSEEDQFWLLSYFVYICMLFCFFMVDAGEIERQSHHECMGSSALAHSSRDGRVGS